MRLFPIPVILFLLGCFAFPARADLPRAAAAVGLAYSAVTGVAAPIDEDPPVPGSEKSAAAGQEKIYFFTADWCQYCPAARKLADQLYGRGFNISVVDCDKHPDLVEKYYVKGIPEFVCTRDGKLIGRRQPAENTTAENLVKSFALIGFHPGEPVKWERSKTLQNGAQSTKSQNATACVGGNCSPAGALPRQPVRATRRRR